MSVNIIFDIILDMFLCLSLSEIVRKYILQPQ